MGGSPECLSGAVLTSGECDLERFCSSFLVLGGSRFMYTRAKAIVVVVSVATSNRFLHVDVVGDTTPSGIGIVSFHV